MSITPICDSIYDCYDGIIATICVANNRDFFMIFASKLFFRCISASRHSVEDCFSMYSYDYTTQILEKVHGIQITGCIFFSKADLYREIKNESPMLTPLSLKIDTYQCPWSDLYHKKHIEHEILVIGIDDDELICIDPYLSEKQQRFRIPNNQCIFECKKYRILQNTPSLPDYLKIMKKNLLICQQILSENFIGLFEVIQNIQEDDISVEYTDNYLLAMRLNTFQNNRICYLRMLDILCSRFGICFWDEMEMMKKEISDIERLRTIIVKNIIKKTIQEKMSYILELVENIFNEEKEVIDSLLFSIEKVLNTNRNYK